MNVIPTMGAAITALILLVHMSVTAKVVSKFFMMASIRRVLVRLKISNSH